MLAALTIVVPTEITHRREIALQAKNWIDSLECHGDSTLPILLLCLLPYFWFVRRPFWIPNGRWWPSLTTWWCERSNERTASRKVTLVAAAVICVTSLAVSWRVSEETIRPRQLKAFAGVRFEREEYRFGELPPAYHDEFSYLFQTETYLAGRLSFPSHPTAARLFDQMHVVNEGHFASYIFQPLACSLPRGCGSDGRSWGIGSRVR